MMTRNRWMPWAVLAAVLLLCGTALAGISGGGGGASAPLSVTTPVVLSNVVPSSYGTSDVSFVPLAKNATEQFVETMGFVVPAGVTSVSVSIVYAMSASNAGDVSLEVDYHRLAAAADPDAAITTQAGFVFTPGTGTGVKVLPSSEDASLVLVVAAGDYVVVRVTRENEAGDTHTGSMNVLDIQVR